MGLFDFLKGEKKPDKWENAPHTVLKATETGTTKEGQVAVVRIPNEKSEFITWGREGSGNGEFKNPKGIAVAPDGSIYVADTYNHRVQVFAPDGSFITKWGREGSGEGEFNWPRGIAVAPDGSIYVADRDNNRVQVFAPDGSFITKWGREGEGNGEFKWPVDIAVAPDGKIYVTDSYNHRVQVFTPEGRVIRKWGSFGEGDGEFSEPGGIAVAPDGNIYMPDEINNRVQVFTPEGRFIRMWGKEGTGEGEFNRPRGIAVTPDRLIYVADSLNSRVQVFTPEGSFIRMWGKESEGMRKFCYPFGIAVTPNGLIYTTDYLLYHRVQVIAEDETVRNQIANVPKATEAGSTKDTETALAVGSNQNREFITWGIKSSRNEELSTPQGIAVAPDGNIYVGDPRNNRVQAFTPEGRFIRELKSKQQYENYFKPAGIAVAPNDLIYVADRGHDRVQEITPEGRFIRDWGKDVGNYGISPSGIAVAPDGRIYVTDYVYDCVQVFTPEGRFIEMWGKEGTGEGEFNRPRGIAVAPNGNIYVTDTNNHRVQVFLKDGRFNRTFGSLGTGEGEFRLPHGIAVAPDGLIYVTDTFNHRVQVFTTGGSFIGMWGREGSGDGEFSFPLGIAVTPDRLIYVADSNNHRVQVIVGDKAVQRWKRQTQEKIARLEREGLAYIDEGRTEEAIVCYNKALNLDQNNYYSMSKYDGLWKLSPEISIELSNTSLTSNKWEQVDLILRNTGRVIGEDISVSFSDVADIRRTETTYTLQPGESVTDTITIRSDATGRAPLDVTMKGGYFGERTFEATSTIWLDISEPGTTSAPSMAGTGPAASPPDSSSLFARYQSHDLIGEGGFGRVYRASRGGKVYAVKVPKTPDSATGKTFISEIQNWTRLSHPNIVRVFDYNILPTPYFEMEYCEASLDSLPKPMSPDQAAWLIYGVCSGLNYAHDQKIIHRDLKPQNILIREGIPKITDWGLSKVLSESKSTTSTSFTPYYAAPEQMGSQPKDERTDIWQLGAILYELVTGTVPFTGESMMEVMMGIMSRDPVKPTDLNPDAKELEPVILRCLEKDPAKRFGSVTELQRVLAFYLKVTYTEALKVSQGSDDRKSTYLCGELLIIHLDSGELPKALLYGKDLIRYLSGENRSALESLVEQMSFCVDEGLSDLPEELMRKAEWIVHGSRLEGMG